MKKIWIFAAAVLSLTLSCSREQGIKPSVSLACDVEGFRKSVWTEDAAAEVADTVRMAIEKQRKLIRIANFLKYYDGYKR
ncbi:MAG: hypothetical protein II031_04970 [Bacteroidales bacterium]|nr:hypothetical protein [Bacteroidales bacterium]